MKKRMRMTIRNKCIVFLYSVSLALLVFRVNKRWPLKVVLISFSNYLLNKKETVKIQSVAHCSKGSKDGVVNCF